MTFIKRILVSEAGIGQINFYLLHSGMIAHPGQSSNLGSGPAKIWLGMSRRIVEITFGSSFGPTHSRIGRGAFGPKTFFKGLLGLNPVMVVNFFYI